MIASLPMYDRPETRAANDRFWALIRENIHGPTPPRLTRKGDLWDHWLAPDLTLSQTCGLPYRARLHGKVTLVGTPVLDLDCAPGHYFSVCLVRQRDTRKTFESFAKSRIAVNEPLSQSGWAAPQNHARDLGFAFGDVLLTGAHRASARAVAEGAADIAAVDAVTWELIRRFDYFAAELRVLTRTPPTPTLPFIAVIGADAGALRAALHAAIDALSETDRRLLCLKGITNIPAGDYLALPTPDFPQKPVQLNRLR